MQVDPSMLADYGPLGAIILALVAGWIVPGYVYRKAVERLEHLEEVFVAEVIPALTRSADALQKLTGPKDGG